MHLRPPIFAIWLHEYIGALIIEFSKFYPRDFEHGCDFVAALGAFPDELQRVSAAELQKSHPARNASVYRDGYLNPSGGWGESGWVVSNLAVPEASRSISIHEGAAFASLIENGNHVTGVWDALGRLRHSDLVVVTAGALTPLLPPHPRTVMKFTAQPVVRLRPENVDKFRPPASPLFGLRTSGAPIGTDFRQMQTAS